MSTSKLRYAPLGQEDGVYLSEPTPTSQYGGRTSDTDIYEFTLDDEYVEDIGAAIPDVNQPKYHT